MDVGAILGIILGLGAIGLFAWLIKRGEARAIEAALNKVDAKLNAKIAKAKYDIAKELAAENEALADRTAPDKFDELFKDSHTD